jgi:antagonist of KipI
MDAIKVISPGGYTTIQDRGRFGFQHMGIPVSGALDNFSFEMANFLVGNNANLPVMEITVVGPCLEIQQEMNIALTGAKMEITINDIVVEQWCSIRVKPGDIINIGQIESGCRSYLSFSGGIDVPEVMGSFSTYVQGAIGGFKGRAIQKDDILKICKTTLSDKQLRVPGKFIPDYPCDVIVRAIIGPQDDYFNDGINTLFSSQYMVTAKADRMGYRLQGDSISIKKDSPKSIISEPSMPGSIQIPPDEQPIILFVEQTVGGYAKIATVISSDLRLVAQTTPGDNIQFEQIDLNSAHNIIIEEQKNNNAIKEIISKV